MGLVIFLVGLNLVISFFNAYSCGKAWVETKHSGGWPRLMNWAGAVMSASGFSWCYLIIVVLVLNHYHVHIYKFTMTDRVAIATLNLGYLLIIPGVLVSGFLITIDSWARAYRTRRVSDMGIAAYNTFADMYNTYNAFESFGDAFINVLDFFKGSDDDDENGGNIAVIIVVVIALFSILAGVITTAAIIHKFAGTEPIYRPITY